jgi:hypothetical protein
MRWIRGCAGLLGLMALVVMSQGCALAIVPGLAGVGAGGYLWGKEAAREKPKPVTPNDATAAQLESPPTGGTAAAK